MRAKYLLYPSEGSKCHLLVCESFFDRCLKFKGTQGQKAPVACLVNGQHFFVKRFGVFRFSKMITKPVINNSSEYSSFKI